MNKKLILILLVCSWLLQSCGHPRHYIITKLNGTQQDIFSADCEIVSAESWGARGGSGSFTVGCNTNDSLTYGYFIEATEFIEVYP